MVRQVPEADALDDEHHGDSVTFVARDFSRIRVPDGPYPPSVSSSFAPMTSWPVPTGLFGRP
jgi:hypothetical protein